MELVKLQVQCLHPVWCQFVLQLLQLPTQLPANAPGAAAGDGLSPWLPAPTGDTHMQLVTPGFGQT